MKHLCVPGALAALLCVGAPPMAASPENIAPKAAIASNSEFSGEFLAKFVADGKIPEADGQQDRSQAWACQGRKHGRGGATITFTWPEPVHVAEIVYYGRTAMVPNENWKDWQLFLDGADKPVQTGQLKSGHGPQRIALKAPATIRSFTLKFLSSYGGPNLRRRPCGRRLRPQAHGRSRRPRSDSGSAGRGTWSFPPAVDGFKPVLGAAVVCHVGRQIDGGGIVGVLVNILAPAPLKLDGVTGFPREAVPSECRGG